jgi:archaellum biogenesis ATPase FlaH
MIEQTIISNLILNEEFTRKVIPYIKEEYFKETQYQILFKLTEKFFEEYNSLPTKEALLVELDNSKGISDTVAKTVKDIINGLTLESTNQDWLLKETEAYCKNRAMSNAILKGYEIVSGENKKQSEHVIPEMMQAALSVSFDTHVGHDYFIDASTRYDLLHNKEHKISLPIEYLNEITDGGTPTKTLNIIVGGVNVGKTLVMCNFAAHDLLQGRDVLYITMEMGWEYIEQRIDLNLLDMSFDDFKNCNKEIYLRKVADLKKKVTGRLICKDYPTATASTAHFRHLLHELEHKENFKPKVVYVDYINLCLSARLKYSSSVTGTYMPIKMIAEELRGLAGEFDYACWSGTQLTRRGFTSSDPGMEDTAESFGLPATADFMGAIVQPEELAKLNQYMFIQWKNRYNSKQHKRGIIGVDLNKQRLYNAEKAATEALVDDSPLPEGHEPKFDTKRFAEFK